MGEKRFDGKLRAIEYQFTRKKRERQFIQRHTKQKNDNRKTIRELKTTDNNKKDKQNKQDGKI